MKAMNCFAIYRLPHASHCTLVEQTSGEPLRLKSCTELDKVRGFVVAPFQITDEQPIWVIRADEVKRLECKSLSKESVQVGKLSSERTINAQLTSSYLSDFTRFHEQIAAGHFSKIVLARCRAIKRNETTSPLHLFQKACALYPRLFIALAALPDGTYWLAATPEILLDGNGNEWHTVALAGTMQLQGDELNGEGETARWSTKNIQEQRYVASYIADCLEQFAIDFKEEGPRTVRAANLVHLRSDFTFTLLNNARVGTLLQALYPTPAVCGLPKRKAFDFIVDNEHTPRQYYSGFMGPFGLNGETHLYVSLRCMQILADEYHLYAGGGLLKDSQMEQEWQETEAKMQTMRQLITES